MTHNERKYTDFELLSLYSDWSEDYYSAGFLSPDAGSVRQFRQWLHNPQLRSERGSDRDLFDYEVEMLAEYARQEREEPL